LTEQRHASSRFPVALRERSDESNGRKGIDVATGCVYYAPDDA
jgi:hypothetical protein